VSPLEEGKMEDRRRVWKTSKKKILGNRGCRCDLKKNHLGAPMKGIQHPISPAISKSDGDAAM